MKRLIQTILFLTVCATAIRCYSREIFIPENDLCNCDTTDVFLMQHSWFVIRGTMSRTWNGNVRLAVTDPIKNHLYDLRPSDNKSFQKTIPMRGPMQEIYLYIPGTITIPVCAGDTIDLHLYDDDIQLSSDNPVVENDLRLAVALFRKARKYEHRMSDIVSSYFKESTGFTEINLLTDSLQQLMLATGQEYQERYNTVIDTFISAHGRPRMEKYFRMSGFYNMLSKFIMTDLNLSVLNPMMYYDSVHGKVNYNVYCDSFLLIPHYRKFCMDYLTNVIRNAQATKIDTVSETKRAAIMLNGIRGLSPTSLCADWATLNYWNNIYRHSGPETAAAFVKILYDSTVSPEIAAEYHRLMHDVLRLSPGEQAPSLTLTDCDGNSYTLEDFKGKYLYLDFWDYGCKPCINEFAFIPELKSHFGNRIKNVEFVTICTSRTSKSKLTRFVRQHDLTELNLILDKDRSDPCYDVNLLPTYVLIDPEGIIVEFNTVRPSEILQKSRSGIPTAFEKALDTE